nr:hypothetical protein [Enterocloster clostridioformis]
MMRDIWEKYKNYTGIFSGIPCNCRDFRKCRYSFFVGISGIHALTYLIGKLREGVYVLSVVDGVRVLFPHFSFMASNSDNAAASIGGL